MVLFSPPGRIFEREAVFLYIHLYTLIHLNVIGG